MDRWMVVHTAGPLQKKGFEGTSGSQLVMARHGIERGRGQSPPPFFDPTY